MNNLTPLTRAVIENGFRNSNLKSSSLESALSGIPYADQNCFRAMLISKLMCAADYEVFIEAIQTTLASYKELAGR